MKPALRRPEPSLLLVALLAHVLAAAWRIHLPGLQYDETLFVNAALGGLDDNYVSARLFGVPVMVMPYIGALKAWLHAPVFALFGVTPLTIRLPVILVSAARVGLTWALLRRLAGPRAAALGLVLLAVDPSWIFAVRTDWGPTSIMGFCAIAAMCSYLRWLESRTWTSLALLWLCLLLGLFDKLLFLWFILAFGLGAAAVHGRELRTRARRGGLAFWGPTLPALCGLAAIVVGLVLPLMRDAPAPAGMPEGLARLRMLGQILIETLDGRSVQDFVFLPPPPEGSGAYWLLAIAPALLCAAWLVTRHRAARSGPDDASGGLLSPLRWATLLLLCSAGLALQAAATRQAGGAHHFQLIWPLPLLAAILSASVLLRPAPRSGLTRLRQRAPARTATAVLLLAGAAILGIGELRTLASYHRRLSDPSAFEPRLSPAIYPLAAALAGEDCALVVSTDWGLHNQLFALAPADRRTRYEDAWVLCKDQDIDARYGPGKLPGRTAFVLHAERYEEQVPARARTLAWLARRHPDGRVLHVPDDEPLYEVWIVGP